MWSIILLVALYLVINRIAKSVAAEPADRSIVQRPRSPTVEPGRVKYAPPRPTIDWIPSGMAIVVGGHRIPGGMCYSGAHATAADGYSIEPALIDPSLPVNWRTPNLAGADMPYWPSYSLISPECRAGFLSWLGSTRDAPATCMGYVFLFYYGLERRALVDLNLSVDAEELRQIATEVERLLEIYGSNQSFNSYGTSFLELLVAALRLVPAAPAILQHGRRWGGEVPLGIRMTLGAHCARKEPLPAEWMLALVRSHPAIHLGTPAHRCTDKFDALFLRRYAVRYGAGLVVKGPKRRITVEYRPASAGLTGSRRVRIPHLPDITELTHPITRLRELAVECTDALDAYSRRLGRNPDGGTDVTALGLLPPELLELFGGDNVVALQDIAAKALGGGGPSIISLSTLVAAWGEDKEVKLTKKQFASLTGLLANLGVGVEPDVRFDGVVPAPNAPVALFALPSGAPSAPTPEYRTTSLLVHLSGMVIGADGSVADVERRRLVEHLESILRLDGAESDRIDAKLAWLAVTKPSTSGLRRKISELSVLARATIGQLLLDLAASDGRITKEEIAMLERIYEVLGLDTQQVYQYIHQVGNDTGPVEVRDPRPEAPRWEIPAPAKKAEGLTLDLTKVRDRLADTAMVSALLADIFREEEQDPITTLRNDSVRAEPGGEVDSPPDTFGLDDRHARLARRLTGRNEWARDEAESNALQLGFPMLDAALDRINEAAMEACGDPLVEGSDPLTINEFALTELT